MDLQNPFNADVVFDHGSTPNVTDEALANLRPRPMARLRRGSYVKYGIMVFDCRGDVDVIASELNHSAAELERRDWKVLISHRTPSFRFTAASAHENEGLVAERWTVLVRSQGAEASDTDLRWAAMARRSNGRHCPTSSQFEMKDPLTLSRSLDAGFAKRALTPVVKTLGALRSGPEDAEASLTREAHTAFHSMVQLLAAGGGGYRGGLPLRCPASLFEEICVEVRDLIKGNRIFEHLEAEDIKSMVSCLEVSAGYPVADTIPTSDDAEQRLLAARMLSADSDLAQTLSEATLSVLT